MQVTKSHSDHTLQFDCTGVKPSLSVPLRFVTLTLLILVT